MGNADVAYLESLREVRIELLRVVAPSLSALDYHKRFALKAAMMNGVAPQEFLLDSDPCLISSEFGEHALNIAALNEEFYSRCQSLSAAAR
jgi:hypothetical protein